MNYLGKSSLINAKVYESLRKITSSKYIWTWNISYQSLYDRAKTIITKNAAVAFYKKEQFYLETDVSSVGHLQPIAFASKSLTSAETIYSNIERGSPRHTP